ncbi:Nitroreductase-like protein [Trichoderma velutinum]
MATQNRLFLSECVEKRHSTRSFLKKPVPRSVLERALTLAKNAPSSSNIQPWRLIIVEGAARDRLAASLTTAAMQGGILVPPVPPVFQQYRSNYGKGLYGDVLGISRTDHVRWQAARLRNYEFFDAPTEIIVTMHKDLSTSDALSVGMYLQILLLALAQEGIASCCQVSVAGYPEILRRELDIPDHLEIICGVAVGYENPESEINTYRVQKEEFTAVTRFVSI